MQSICVYLKVSRTAYVYTYKNKVRNQIKYLEVHVFFLYKWACPRDFTLPDEKLEQNLKSGIIFITNPDNAIMQHDDPRVWRSIEMRLYLWASGHAVTSEIWYYDCCHFWLVFWKRLVPPETSQNFRDEINLALVPYSYENYASVVCYLLDCLISN